MTLGDYMTYWFETYRKPYQEKNTQASCWSMIAHHILPSALGKMELEDITAKDCQLFLLEERLHGSKRKMKYVDFTGTPLSAHSIIKLRQLLIAAFHEAQKEHLVRENVAEDTKSIPLPWHNAGIFTPENQRRFLERARHHRFYVAYVLCFYLGLRRSEVLGLSWDSIDLRRSSLKIRQALLLEDGKVVLRPRTKTKASLREIPFPKAIRDLLSAWRRQQKQEARQKGYSNPHQLVFTNKDGSPHNPSYFSRNFKSMVKRLDFLSDDLHLHSTRHTWATNMLQCGASITDVQALGGWSRPDTLLNIYAHTVKESQRKAMKKLYDSLQ